MGKIGILISDAEHLQTKFICTVMTHNHKGCEIICVIADVNFCCLLLLKGEMEFLSVTSNVASNS